MEWKIKLRAALSHYRSITLLRSGQADPGREEWQTATIVGRRTRRHEEKSRRGGPRPLALAALALVHPQPEQTDAGRRGQADGPSGLHIPAVPMLRMEISPK